jgi:hypothetical protein
MVNCVWKIQNLGYRPTNKCHTSLEKKNYLGTLGSFGYVCTSRDVLTNIRRFKHELR